MNLVGEGALVTGVLPDVFPVIDVEDLQPDGWRLADWRLAMGFDFRQPAAGLTAEIPLENITTTGTLAVLEKVVVSTLVDSQINWGYNTAGSVLAGNANNFKSFRDRREPVSPPLPVLSVTNGDAIGFSITGRANILARVPFELESPDGLTVLQPGSLFMVQNGTVDARLEVTYFWRERAIDPAENNF